MKNTGQLIVISAPSGCGKTTLENMLLDSGLGLVKSISVTTRQPREGELGGQDYYFISEKDFLEKRDSGEFVESAEVFGNHYATSRIVIDSFLKDKKNVILSIDVQGAKQIRKVYPDALFIFIKSPSLKDLEDRLIKRGTDTIENIKKRLAFAESEIKQSTMYDFIVVNEDLSKALIELTRIIKRKIEGY